MSPAGFEPTPVHEREVSALDRSATLVGYQVEYCRVPPVSDKMGSLLEQDPTEKWLKSTYRPQSDYLIQLRVFLTLDICVIL